MGGIERREGVEKREKQGRHRETNSGKRYKRKRKGSRQRQEKGRKRREMVK